MNGAGRVGLSQLAATPDGQHALAVVYDHADGGTRQFMRQHHEEQGNTAVDYTEKGAGDTGTMADDPLNVSDAGVEIGPRISVGSYLAMTGGVIYGLAENAVVGIAQTVEAVCKESEELKGVDNLEYADIDDYAKKSNEPGLLELL